MCRLFAYRGRAPTCLGRSLVHGDNALAVQSREHPDGWGIAWYPEGEPQPRVLRATTPAWGDDAFAEATERARSRTVVAHVRKATVGAVDERNCHPFRRGPFTFAHNGTIEGWERVRGAVEARIVPDLRAELRGDTDSERLFLLLLGELAAQGADLAAGLGELAPERLVDACARVADILSGAWPRGGPPRPTALNFVLTDGEVLAAHRLGRDLHYLVSPGAEGSGPHVVVSSERIGPETGWREVPERGLITVDGELRTHVRTWEPRAA